MQYTTRKMPPGAILLAPNYSREQAFFHHGPSDEAEVELYPEEYGQRGQEVLYIGQLDNQVRQAIKEVLQTVNFDQVPTQSASIIARPHWLEPSWTEKQLGAKRQLFTVQEKNQNLLVFQPQIPPRTYGLSSRGHLYLKSRYPETKGAFVPILPLIDSGLSSSVIAEEILPSLKQLLRFNITLFRLLRFSSRSRHC